MQPVDLTDGVVLLDLPVDGDVEEMTLACQDREVTAWTPLPLPYLVEHARGFIGGVVLDGWAKGTNLNWAIREIDGEQRLAGMIGLHGLADGSAEIGYWLAPWARGRGLAARAVALVLDHAFAPGGLDLDHVLWVAYVGNWPSRRLAWRAGFRMEATVRGFAAQRGSRVDSWLGTLLRDDPREAAEPWTCDAPPDGAAVHPAGAVRPDRAPRGTRESHRASGGPG